MMVRRLIRSPLLWACMTIVLLSAALAHPAGSSASLSNSALALQSPLSTPTPTPREFVLPVARRTLRTWPAFTGVGSALRYLSGWNGRPYQAQGGVRDGATYEFVWTDAQGFAARIDVLEIVNPDTGQQAMVTEMSYWREYGVEHGYLLESVTVQGHPAWWVHATEPQDVMGVVGVLWVDWGDRVYRVVLCCRPEVRDESERLLRQVLFTLEAAAVDWGRASGPPPQLPDEVTLEDASAALAASTASASMFYNRNAAYNYAYTYHGVTANDDGCYLWSNGSVVDCT